MRIGGLQPVTLLDYPQKLAAIIFTANCNMRCPFCYNSQLVIPEKINENDLYDQQQVLNFLAGRKKYLDGIVITGGEPLLQFDLAEFCQKLKNFGYLIKLDTNGLLPQKMKELIEQKLIDYVAMDIKGPLDQYQKFAGVSASSSDLSASIDLIKQSGLPYEFRSTIAKNFHTNLDIELMAQSIEGAEKYFLQNFSRPHQILDESFAGEAFSKEEMSRWLELVQKYIANVHLR